MAKILVIEDDRALRKIYVSILTKEGYEVAVAVDGADGLRLANENEPDLVLLDMMMPRMNGIEFLRAYDIKGKHPTVKVIAFSNTEMPEFVHGASQLGASTYVLKSSFTPKGLVSLVKETLAGAT